jgi:hypothetical protein
MNARLADLERRGWRIAVRACALRRESTPANSETHMNTTTLMILAATGLALGGCNKAENPSEVRQDIAEAQAEGNSDVADARAEAQKDSIEAESDVTKAVANHNINDAIDESHEASKVAAKGDARIQLAQAEAAHKVATEKCELVSGDAQKDCKARADADFDNAKQHAEMSREAVR